MEDFNLNIKVNANEVKNTLPTLKDLRKELKAVQSIMAGLDEGSDEFLKAANKAGTLKHQIDAIRQATNGASADFGDMLGNITRAGAGIVGTFQAIQASLSLLGVESESVTESIKTMQNMMAITQGLTAIDTGIKSLNKLRNAITGTSAAAKVLKAVMTPKAILAIVAAVTALTFAYDKLTEKSRAAAKAKEEELKKAKETADAYKNDVAKSAGNVLAIYEKLRTSYQKLQTQSEKQKWIQNNKNELNKLGLSINNVNDAEDKFVKNSSKIIQGFQLRAEAAANENLAVKAYEDYIKKLEEVQSKAVHAGDIARGKSFNVGGDVTLDNEGQYRYTQQGAIKKNQQLINKAGLNELKKVADDYTKAGVDLLNKANDLLGVGNQQVETKTEQIKKDVKTAKDIAQEEYELELAILNLSKERGDDETSGVKYYEKMLILLNNYKDKLKEASSVSEIEFVRIDTEIAKVQNNIDNFGKEDDGLSEFDQKLIEIETELAKIDAVFSGSEQTENDELIRLQGIIEAEKERLKLLEESGDVGTESWYRQQEAINKYEKELKALIDTEKKRKQTITDITKFTVGSFDAVSGVLGDLASTQDTTSREGFETAKKLNIAQATMSMLSGLTSIIAGTYTTHTGPWDIALAAVQAAAVLASGIININNIKKQTFDGGGDISGAAANITQSSVNQMITPPTQYVNDIQGAELLGQIRDTRVYVSETDISNVSKKVNVQESENFY